MLTQKNIPKIDEIEMFIEEVGTRKKLCAFHEGMMYAVAIPRHVWVAIAEQPSAPPYAYMKTYVHKLMEKMASGRGLDMTLRS